MCINCRLTTPNGSHDVCHACAVALRSEARRGLDALEQYLRRYDLERLADEE
ncbi:MAG TPA: hypothetical protein VLA87_07880 [Gaiellaceae bacterium]|nr:hypothetical protein [Gaiellaceae bacterium]